MTRWQTLLPALWAPTGAHPHPAPVFGASGACRRGPSGSSGPSPGAAPALSPTGQNRRAQLPPPRQLHRAPLPTCRLPAPGLLSEEQRSPPGPTWASRSRGTSGEGSLDFREPGFVSSGKTRGHRNDRCDREFTLMDSQTGGPPPSGGARGSISGRGCAQGAHWIPRKEGGRHRTGPCGCSGCGRRAVPGVRYLPG